MSLGLPPKLQADLRAMSQNQYQSINSILVRFARGAVKEWKEELAREAETERERRAHESGDDQEEWG